MCHYLFHNSKPSIEISLSLDSGSLWSPSTGSTLSSQQPSSISASTAYYQNVRDCSCLLISLSVEESPPSVYLNALLAMLNAREGLKNKSSLTTLSTPIPMNSMSNDSGQTRIHGRSKSSPSQNSPGVHRIAMNVEPAVENRHDHYTDVIDVRQNIQLLHISYLLHRIDRDCKRERI